MINNLKLVDQLMKDHVTAYGDEFDVAGFIPLLTVCLALLPPAPPWGPVLDRLVLWLGPFKNTEKGCAAISDRVDQGDPACTHDGVVSSQHPRVRWPSLESLLACNCDGCSLASCCAASTGPARLCCIYRCCTTFPTSTCYLIYRSSLTVSSTCSRTGTQTPVTATLCDSQMRLVIAGTTKARPTQSMRTPSRH